MENKYLDAIEDAEEALKLHRRICWGLGTLFTVFVLMFLGGIFTGVISGHMGVALGNLAFSLIIVGLVGGGLCIMVSVLYYDGMSGPSPAKRLRRARREYRDYMTKVSGL